MSWSANQFMMVILMVGVVLKVDKMFGKYPTRLQHMIRYGLFAFVVVISGITMDRGWPVHKADMDNFVFISGVVQEPTSDSEGKIYIWVRIKDDPSRPYAVELDYTPELAKAVHLANLKSVLDGEMSVDLKDIVQNKKIRYEYKAI
jgi:hypothetical protein